MKYLLPLLLFFACTPQPQQAIQQGGIVLTDQNGKQYTLSGNLQLSTLGEVQPPDTVVIPEPTGKGKLGINTHPWIRPALLGDIKLHRHYLSSYYFWTGKGGKIKPQPMLQAGTPQAWGLDDVLNNAKAEGAEVLFTIHQCPTWLADYGRTDGGSDAPPIEIGQSRTDTNSYREYALMLRQVVMRYGSKKYPDRLLNVDTSARWNGDKNVKKSGQNSLKWLQFWNEEKIWKQGGPEYIEPEALAAMMSICYDMIKATDPNMIVVSPCLSNAYMPYFQALDDWFRKNRKDKKWPCDIISCNYYLNKGNKDGQFLGQWVMSGGCRPSEDPGFFRVKQLADFCAARGKKLWLTETGLDSKEADQSQMAFPGTEAERANALIETANAMFASGVDVVFLFTAANEYNAGKTLYQQCGLLYGQDKGYAKKPSFDLVNNYAKSLSLKAMQQPAMEDRTKRFVIPSK